MRVTMTRIPWGFRGWNQDTAGRTRSRARAACKASAATRRWRSWDTEVQRRTRNAIVRPMMEVGPIAKRSTSGDSLMMSIGGWRGRCGVFLWLSRAIELEVE